MQTWMTGLVTEVKRKSPSMVHRWVSGERVEEEDEQQQQQPGSGRNREEERSGPVKLEKIEEQVEFSAAGLRSTIKSKLNLNELYDKFSKTRDIKGLFQRTKTPTMDEEQLSDRYVEMDDMTARRQESPTESLEEHDDDEEDEEDDDEEEETVQPEKGVTELPKVEIEGVNHKMLGNASSPKHSQDEEFQFSFEDFSFIESRKTPAKDKACGVALESHKASEEGDSGCVDKSKESEQDGEVEKIKSEASQATKPRRLNIGEIGRSASASHQQHPDSGIDLGTMGGHTKRHLLSDIGRRFSEMNESSDLEFRSDSLRQDGSLNQFRPNSMPVSPKPRMLLPAQHRGSTDFTGGKHQRGNSLLREYSTQVRSRAFKELLGR